MNRVNSDNYLGVSLAAAMLDALLD